MSVSNFFRTSVLQFRAVIIWPRCDFSLAAANGKCSIFFFQCITSCHTNSWIQCQKSQSQHHCNYKIITLTLTIFAFLFFYFVLFFSAFFSEFLFPSLSGVYCFIYLHFIWIQNAKYKKDIVHKCTKTSRKVRKLQGTVSQLLAPKTIKNKTIL